MNTYVGISVKKTERFSFKEMTLLYIMEFTREKKEQIWQQILNDHLRLLGLYTLRLKYLETRDDRLELCRVLRNTPMDEREALVQTYTEHFETKIASLQFDIENIRDRKEEYFEDFIK